VKHIFAIEDLDDFLSHPLDYIKSSYKWGESDFNGDRLVDGLYHFL